MTIGRGGRALNLTSEGVFKTLREIFEQRGRKNTDRADTIKILRRLYEVCTTTYQKIRVLLALVPARLDYSQYLASMPQDSWMSCRDELDQLVTLLIENGHYVVQEQVDEYDDMVEREPQMVKGVQQRVQIAGNVVTMVESLDSEVSSEDEANRTMLIPHSGSRCSKPRTRTTEAPSMWIVCGQSCPSTPP